MIILSKELQVKSANKAFYEIFRFDQREIEGKYIFDMSEKEWDITELRKVLADLRREQPFKYGVEAKCSFSNVGEKVLVFNARKLFLQTQNQEFTILSIQDITSHYKNQQLLLEKEAWLENMTENLPTMIWVAGADRLYTYVNRSWLQYTGRPLAQEINNGWLDEIHKDDIGQYLEIFKTSYDLMQPFEVEYRMRRHDGAYRWLLCRAVPNLSDGKFAGFIGSCTEVHDKRMMQEELEKLVNDRTQDLKNANLSLQKSNRELEQFAFVASHDLQEPLRKILTFSNQLEDKYRSQLPDDAQLYLKKVIHSSNRMSQLIDDVLNFSRLSGAWKVDRQVNINFIIEDLLNDFELPIKENNVDFSISNLPLIDANPGQVRQIFHNLLSNALKFRQDNQTLKIEIEGRELEAEEVRKIDELDPNTAYVEIRFRDNGIGFSEEYKDQVFVIFQRLHDKKKYPGTGIGLTIIKRIMENHRGYIYVDSQEGEGTEFHLVLPKYQP